MSNVLNLIDELGEAEDSLTEKEFVSPVFYNTQVAARVLGMTYTFQVPKRKPGWYLFRPVDTKKARITGEADFIQIEEYMKCLPKLRLVITQKVKDVYQGLPIKNNKFGLPNTSCLPILLTDDMALEFDQVLCRYDGVNIWYEGYDVSYDPSRGDYLRKCFEKLVDAKTLRYPGLTFEEKAAYNLRVALDKKFHEDRKKVALQTDVEHAGGTFKSFRERKDNFVVSYEVDGHQYESIIAKDTHHTVLTAGVCLSGGDRAFDLKSLITVLREGQHRRLIHRY